VISAAHQSLKEIMADPPFARKGLTSLMSTHKQLLMVMLTLTYFMTDRGAAVSL